ncbi:TetR family transcriptional regulator, partial [Tsukamurella tyrosinosolvens]|uniref:TetR/AcrR family transcriptional regulator n=1 Tax=Tsukamurella tyrosinosolvens TaxID=57704 RepID=UPI002480EAAC
MSVSFGLGVSSPSTLSAMCIISSVWERSEGIALPRQVDHRQRREEIARALWRVVDTSGALRLSLREVAKEAGMSHGQVQHYFTSRRELLLFATDFAAERTAERIAAGLADLGPDPHPRDLLRLT